MGAFRNFIIGTLGVAVISGATALAIPQSRNFVLDKIAQKSEIYKTAVANNDDLKKSNDDKTAEIVKLQGELETKQTALAKCESDLKSVTETKTTIETQLASKTTEVEELTADKTKLTTDLETANADKANLQTQLDSVTAEKQALETKKSELTTQVESLTEQKTELENQLATANSDKVSLQSQLENVNKQLTTTQTELINTQTSLQSKTAEADTLTNQLSDKQNQIDTLTSQLSAKQTELDQANADKANLQSQFDGLIAELNELKTQVSKLESEKADLQKQVDDLTASANVVVTKKPALEFEYDLPSGDHGFTYLFLNTSADDSSSISVFKHLFDKVNYPTQKIALSYTYFCSGTGFDFDSANVYRSSDKKLVNNLNMKFYAGSPDNNTFLGENLDFLNCVAENTFIYWNSFNYEYKLSADGSAFDDFTINFYLNQFKPDSSKASKIYKSSTSDKTISIFSGLNCLTFTGDPSVYKYTISDGLMTVYNNYDNSIFATIDVSNPQQIPYGGETYTLQSQESNVTA